MGSRLKVETPEVYEGGAGEPLVLLHGVGGSWRIWKPVIPLLERHYRVIVPNLPGHPGGAALSGAPTVAVLADTLIAQLQARGIRSAHIAGNSLGGWLAVELARRGFARSVTALSPAGAWKSDAAFALLADRLSLQFRLMPVLYVLFWLFMFFGWMRRALARDTMKHGERVSTSEFRRMLRSFRDADVLLPLFANTGAQGGLAPFDAGDVTVRVAWCEDDRILPFETYGVPFIAKVSGAETIVIDGVGHVPMYDDPTAVARVIADGCRAAVAAA
jgi:pimeloyl-ACP methyl ester carboxylesterase